MKVEKATERKRLPHDMQQPVDEEKTREFNNTIIFFAMQIEFSMAPKTLPMAEMGQQATKEPENEGEEKKEMENLTQDEFKKQLAAMNRQYNQRFFGGNNPRGNNRGRGRGNNQRGAQSYRGNAWNQSHGNQGGR